MSGQLNNQEVFIKPNLCSWLHYSEFEKYFAKNLELCAVSLETY